MHRHSTARRNYAAQLLAVAGIGLVSGYPPFQLLAGQAGTAAASADSRHYFRRYQATAYISLFSINLLTRSGVGFGYAKADEEIFPQRRNLSLQFLSGSIPERAHGLNRFGFIEENIKERDSVCAEADYFGLMTASGEQSLSQAKAALDDRSQQVPFVAAEAVIDQKHARYSIRHILLAPKYREAADADKLLGQVRAAFDQPEAGQAEHRQTFDGDPFGTFLYSAREAMLPGEDKLQKRFLYNGKMFKMDLEKHVDGKTGRELQASGLLADAAEATMLTGAIRNEGTGQVTNFRLWFDRGSPDLLPLRFEFRPKSYLRLVFQAMPGGAGQQPALVDSRSGGTKPRPGQGRQ